jgi:hypothetical protein
MSKPTPDQKDTAQPSNRTIHPLKRKWDYTVGVLSIVIGVVGALGSLLTIPYLWSTISSPSIKQLPLEAREVREEQLELIRGKLKDLDDKIAALSVPPDESRNALQVKILNDNVAKLQESVSDMQRLIVDNPSKALAVPLMRKDLDSLKENNQAEMASIRKDVDRIYDLNKWLVGLMFTMALGVLTLAISNFWKSKEKAAETEQNTTTRDAPGQGRA